MTTVQYVLASAFALVIFVTLVNAAVFLFVRGAARAALDEGVRFGSRAGAAAGTCEARADDVLRSLVGAALRPDVRVTCDTRNDIVVRARAEVRVASWWPGVPDWEFTLQARSARERIP
jgi:hypothetical protein